MTPWDDWTGTYVPEADVMTRLRRKEMESIYEASVEIRDSIIELAKELRTANALAHETKTTIEAGFASICDELIAIARCIAGGQV
jgi:hypothetical protein